ncbi:MAG: hypothetical protein M0R02_04170 [Bacteroidales bacterium]|jgi:hypothetical protein|nr:hypothetical protein [Bacteroidales bacterium]NLK80724.1 hypothetical protein [Bacteroidales bacterium]
MTQDKNSNITNISYNFLNLPNQITQQNFTHTQSNGNVKMVTEQTTYIHYNAAGQKQMYEVKTSYSDGTQQWEQILYQGIIVYRGTSTSFSQAPHLQADYMVQPEGRIRISKNAEQQMTWQVIEII